jgi:hypothetical protein
MNTAADEFDSTRDTRSGSAAALPPAPVPVRTPSTVPRTAVRSTDLSLLEKTRYTHFRDQTTEPPCFLCLMQEAESEDAIFGSPSSGLISRVTAYWHTHYANQSPRKELAEACMELIRREQELWSFDGAPGEALACTTALGVYQHFTEHLMDHESSAEYCILADLAHNASALHPLPPWLRCRSRSGSTGDVCFAR